MCECEFCEKIAEIVIEGLAQLDNIICAVMLSSFKAILDVGLAFVPGGQAPTAVKAAVQGAKSFHQNGEEAASFFGDWVGPACGVPDFHFDISMVFGELLGAPDSMSRGPPVGCKRKNKSECRKVDPVPDPSKKPDQPKPTDKPKTTDGPKTTDKVTTTDKPTTTTTDPSSNTGAPCAYCGEFDKKKARRDDKYGLLFSRAGNSNNGPSCKIPPPTDDLLEKRGLFGFVQEGLLSRSFPLIGRALSEKTSKVELLIGKAQEKWELFVGKYASRSEAKDIPAITKYWTYAKPVNAKTCSVKVEKEPNRANINLGDYDS